MTDQEIYRDPLTGTAYDPLRVHRRLVVGSKNEFNLWLRDHRGEDELKALAADDKILPVVRDAFGLPPVSPDGGGITDAQAFMILERYLEYARGKGQRGQPSPASSPCADCPRD